jgi:hypothetical protein
MKKATMLLVILAALLSVMPAAAGEPRFVGDRISITGGLVNFPAGKPFHINHGWWAEFLQPKDRGIVDFDLYIDGIEIRDRARYFSIMGTEPEVYGGFYWAWNFPRGMKGNHVFRGEWQMQCQVAVQHGLFQGICLNPNAMVTIEVKTIWVSFFP